MTDIANPQDHAAPPARPGQETVASGTPATAGAAPPCTRRIEPDFTQNCPNQSAGGLRLTLRPHETVEKRWGTHSLLSFVMDLPVCATCFPKVQIMEITDERLRSALVRFAQQGNNGILVDWKRTVIEHLAFDHPDYVMLRKQMEKSAAANDSPTAPAAPQP